MKWQYIREISSKSNRYGDKLLELMEKYGAYSLREITEQQAAEFLRNLQKER